jgi:hypothetical protein
MKIDGIDVLPDFVHRAGNHCVTSALGAGLRTIGVEQPEEVLFGLGQGLGGAYFDFKNLLPFLGGRRGGKNGDFELDICTALGVPAHAQSSIRAKKVVEWACAELDKGRAAVVYVDMAFLPYFNFPPDEHFGGHVVAIVGYSADRKSFIVADRSEDLATLAEDDFIKARTSKFAPFPAIGTQIFLSEVTERSIILGEEMEKAIRANMQVFLNPPINNVGVNATAKFAAEVVKWEQKFDSAKLSASLMNIYIYVEVGGTGGAAFRRMYSRFLQLAGNKTGKIGYQKVSQDLAAIADEWTKMALLCKEDAERVAREEKPNHIQEIGSVAAKIAHSERTVLEQLLSV